MPPAPGIVPRLISGWPKRAFSAAMTMSHIIAISQPPPSAKPATAAMTGLRHCATRSQPLVMKSSAIGLACRSCPAISLMSAPAAKAFSLPVRTMAPIAGSPSRSSSAAPSSAISAAFSAFSACGRFSVTMPTGPCRSTRMLLYCRAVHRLPLPQRCNGSAANRVGSRREAAPDYGGGRDWDRNHNGRAVAAPPGSRQVMPQLRDARRAKSSGRGRAVSTARPRAVGAEDACAAGAAARLPSGSVAWPSLAAAMAATRVVAVAIGIADTSSSTSSIDSAGRRAIRACAPRIAPEHR